MKNQSARLIMKVLFLAVPVCVICISMILVYSKNHFLPTITSNISLDAKIYESQRKDLDRIKLLSIGSSITLNNLNSKTLLENLKVSYYNYGAWGLQISDIHHLLKLFTSEYNPEYVLICSSITDFRKGSDFNLPNVLEFKISSFHREYFFLKNLSFLSLTKHKEEYTSMKKDTSGYKNLNFDQYGGMPLDIPSNKISKKRWDEILDFPTKQTEFQYSELRELAGFLHTKSIKLIFIQAPMSERFAYEELEKVKLSNHFNTCKSIIESNGGIYYNLYNTKIFPDSLYVDKFHLSEQGSQIFTKLVSYKLIPIFNKLQPTSTTSEK